MKEKLINCYLKGKFAVRDFLSKEKGASEMVVILVLIVIIIAVASTFQTELRNAVTDAFKKLTDFINK